MIAIAPDHLATVLELQFRKILALTVEILPPRDTVHDDEPELVAGVEEAR